MDDPWIRRVERSKGPDEALVYIKGYLSEPDDDEDSETRWRDCFRKAGWRRPHTIRGGEAA